MRNLTLTDLQALLPASMQANSTPPPPPPRDSQATQMSFVDILPQPRVISSVQHNTKAPEHIPPGTVISTRTYDVAESPQVSTLTTTTNEMVTPSPPSKPASKPAPKRKSSVSKKAPASKKRPSKTKAKSTDTASKRRRKKDIPPRTASQPAISEFVRGNVLDDDSTESHDFEIMHRDNKNNNLNNKHQDSYDEDDEELDEPKDLHTSSFKKDVEGVSYASDSSGEILSVHTKKSKRRINREARQRSSNNMKYHQNDNTTIGHHSTNMQYHQKDNIHNNSHYHTTNQYHSTNAVASRGPFADNHQTSRDKQGIKSMINMSCPMCTVNDCHDRTLGDFLEQMIDNYAFTNKKTTLSHKEVYGQMVQSYNVIMHHRSHLSTHEIGCGVLLLPQCLYSGAFQRSYKKWSVDIKKEREVRKTHLSWLNKREQDLQRQKNRKSNYQVL